VAKRDVSPSSSDAESGKFHKDLVSLSGLAVA